MQAYSKQIVKEALAFKAENNHKRIKLPTFDAPLMRALGVEFTTTKEEGIKRKPILHGEISELPTIEYDEKSLEPLLEAIRELKAQGEEVLMDVQGTFYVMSWFLPFESWVKATKNHPELFEKLVTEINGILHDYYLRIDEAGADYVCMSDGISVTQIVGHKFYKNYIGPALTNLIDVSEKITHAHLLICPKTFMSLKDFGILEKDEEGIIHPTNCSITTRDASVGAPYKIVKERK